MQVILEIGTLFIVGLILVQTCTVKPRGFVTRQQLSEGYTYSHRVHFPHISFTWVGR